MFFSTSIQAQTKTKDIDVLYQKYKNRDTIVITNAEGSVKLAVDIVLNSKGKPQSIVLKGYVSDYSLAQNLVRKLENDKTRAGYKYSTFSTVYSDEIMNVSVYTKGTEYAKYGVQKDIFGKDIPPPPYEGNEPYMTEQWKKKREAAYYRALFGYCFIYLEVGDISRKLNDNSEDFKF